MSTIFVITSLCLLYKSKNLFFIDFFQFPTKMMVQYELAINSKKYGAVYDHSNNSRLSMSLARQLKFCSHAASSPDLGLRMIYMTGQDVASLLASKLW